MGYFYTPIRVSRSIYTQIAPKLPVPEGLLGSYAQVFMSSHKADPLCTNFPLK